MNGLMAVTRSAKERLPVLYTARASRPHRYVDNQRVKQKIVLPTTAMVNFSIDIASLFTLEINREIFIPNREVGRFSILGKKSGDLPPNWEAWKL